MIAVYGERNHMPFAVAGLSRTLTNVLVLSIGFLMLLRMFGVEITPILTALGVGGLAVALACRIRWQICSPAFISWWKSRSASAISSGCRAERKGSSRISVGARRGF